jgi:hypothetical protein
MVVWLGTFLLGDVSRFMFVGTSLNATERQKRWFLARILGALPRNLLLTMDYAGKFMIRICQRQRHGGFPNLTQGSRVTGYGPIGNGNIDNTYKVLRAPWYRLQVTPAVVRLGYGRSFDIGVFGRTSVTWLRRTCRFSPAIHSGQ